MIYAIQSLDIPTEIQAIWLQTICYGPSHLETLELFLETIFTVTHILWGFPVECFYLW